MRDFFIAGFVGAATSRLIGWLVGRARGRGPSTTAVTWWTPAELTKPFDITTCPSCKNVHRHLYAAMALHEAALHSIPPRDRAISRLVIICPATGEPMHFALDAPNLMPAATPWGATR